MAGRSHRRPRDQSQTFLDPLYLKVIQVEIKWSPYIPKVYDT